MIGLGPLGLIIKCILTLQTNVIALSAVMRDGDEYEKLVLDGLMNQFFTAHLQQVRNYTDPTGAVHQPRGDDIVHL